MAINKVILVGNVGKDPEIRTMTNGNELATFSLATSDSWKDKTTGERKEKTEWHRIVVSSPGLVNIAKQYIKKGSKLYIEGSIQTRKWVGNDGIEKYATEIILQKFNSVLQILDSRNNNSGGSSNFSDDENSSNNSDSSSLNNADEFVDEKLDDDIPF
jgi:single-strand DNA-binding protein